MCVCVCKREHLCSADEVTESLYCTHVNTVRTGDVMLFVSLLVAAVNLCVSHVLYVYYSVCVRVTEREKVWPRLD